MLCFTHFHQNSVQNLEIFWTLFDQGARITKKTRFGQSNYDVTKYASTSEKTGKYTQIFVPELF